MTMRRWTRALAVIVLAGAAHIAGAQQDIQRTRSTSTTGANDSLLVSCSDSVRPTPRIRACAGVTIRTMVASGNFVPKADSTWNIGSATGRYRKGYFADTLFGGLFSGTATLAKNLTGSPAITVSSCTGCGGGVTYPLTATSGSAAAPSYQFNTASDTEGVYRPGPNRVGIATSGKESFHVNEKQQIVLDSTVSGLPNIIVGSDSTNGLRWNPGANSLQYRWGGSPAITFFGNSSKSMQVGYNGSSGAATISQSGNNNDGIFFGTGSVGLTDATSTYLKFDNTGSLGGGSGRITGGAGNMTIQAGTGNSRTMTLQTTTSAGTAKNTLVLGADSSITSIGLFKGPDGASGTPTYGFSGVSNTGMYRSGAGGIELAVGGFNILDISTSSLIMGAKIKGLAGSAAVPSFTFNADTLLGLSQKGTAGASDSLVMSSNGVAQVKIGAAGVLLLPNLPSEGSTKNAVCWDGTTFNVTQNAAATCTVSAARFKTDIVPVPFSTASHIVDRLQATSYREKQGGRLAFGIIADSAAVVDRRLASFDSKGLVTSTNYEEVTTLLLAKVQEQQKEIGCLAHANTKSQRRRCVTQ